MKKILILLLGLSMTAQAQLENLRYKKASKNNYIGIGFVHKDSIIDVDGDRFINALSIRKDSFDNNVICIVRTNKRKKAFVFGILGYQEARIVPLEKQSYFIRHIGDYAIHIKSDSTYMWMRLVDK